MINLISTFFKKKLSETKSARASASGYFVTVREEDESSTDDSPSNSPDRSSNSRRSKNRNDRSQNRSLSRMESSSVGSSIHRSLSRVRNSLSRSPGRRILHSSQCFFKLDFGTASISMEGISEKHLSDAFFVSPYSIGIFDAVSTSGEEHKNLLNAKYARHISKHTEHFIKHRGTSQIKKALTYAEEKTRKEGSSTATVLGISGNFLEGVQVGNCNVMVIRDDKVVFKTESMEHSFGNPEKLLHGQFASSLGMPISVELQEYDIIIVASDGVWDNVYDNWIVRLVGSLDNDLDDKASRTRKPRSSRNSETYGMMSLARAIAQKAKDYSQDEEWESPYWQSAVENGEDKHEYIGGREDHITVATAMVLRNHSSDE